MEDPLAHAQGFSLAKRAKSFSHAGRGLWILFRTAHNSWLHLAIMAAAIALGAWLRITQIEWVMIALASGLVLSAEAFNTAIEIDMDLTSPQYHPFARDTKDVAAGAVLISAITALVVAALVFLPYLYL
jgi:diacylglycerol kinase